MCSVPKLCELANGYQRTMNMLRLDAIPGASLGGGLFVLFQIDKCMNIIMIIIINFWIAKTKQKRRTKCIKTSYPQNMQP